MSKNYSRVLATAIADMLNDETFLYGFDREEGMFLFPYFASRGNFHVYAVFMTAYKDSITCSVLFPVRGDVQNKQKMDNLYKASVMINWCMKFTHLQVDSEKGAMRFCTSLDMEGQEDQTPSRDQVSNLLCLALNNAIRYSPVITACLYDPNPDIRALVDACEHRTTTSPSFDLLKSMLEARENGGNVSPELVEAIDAVLFDHDGEDAPDTPLFEGDCSETDQEDEDAEDSLDDASNS